jgi:septal ring factor EnvC (AmiA/AmiB activator)
MRWLFICAVAGGMAGCAQGIPPARLQAHMLAAEQWQRRYQEERGHTEALAERLAAAEAALERVTSELAEADQAQVALNEELERSEVARRTLEDFITHLQAQKRELSVMHEELSEMHEEMTDVWYESALSRARRYSPPPPPPPAAPTVEGTRETLP